MALFSIRAGRFAAAGGLLGVWLMGSTLADPAGRVVLAQAPPAAPAAQSVDASLSQLHQKLQITPAQEPQFNAVAGVMRDNARSMPSAAPARAANPTAVDDLRAYIQFSEQELAGLKKLLPALDALYASLSPTQKKTADTVFRQGPGG